MHLAPRNALQLPPRTVLHNSYIVGRALGDGGFGITYFAWDTAAQTRVAIKEYIPNGIAGRSATDTSVLPYEQTRREFKWGLDRFLDEARTLKKFSNHDGIVSVETVFSDNGTAYLVMEFLDGVDVRGISENARGGFVFHRNGDAGDAAGDGRAERRCTPKAFCIAISARTIFI